MKKCLAVKLASGFSGMVVSEAASELRMCINHGRVPIHSFFPGDGGGDTIFSWYFGFGRRRGTGLTGRRKLLSDS